MCLLENASSAKDTVVVQSIRLERHDFLEIIRHTSYEKVRRAPPTNFFSGPRAQHQMMET